MRIQEALSNCCQSFGTALTSVGQWLGRTVTAIGSGLYSFGAKVVAVVTPYFASLATFIKNNQTSVIIATVGVAIGAVICAAVSSLCKTAPSKSNQPAEDSLATFLAVLADKPSKKDAQAAFKALNKDAQRAVRKHFAKKAGITDKADIATEFKKNIHKKNVLSAVKKAIAAEEKKAAAAAKKASA